MQQTRFADLYCEILNNRRFVQDITEPVGIIVGIMMVHIIGIDGILKSEIWQLHKKDQYLLPTNDGHGALILIGLRLEHFGQHTFTVALQFRFVLVLTKSLYKSFPINAIIHVHTRKAKIAHQNKSNKKSYQNGLPPFYMYLCLDQRFAIL